MTDAAGNSTSPTSFHINISATAPLPKAPDDLNLDGESDIAWRNVGGDFTVWNSHVASTQFSAADIGFVSADWQIAGFGDFSAAGGSSVLWRNSNGQVVTWNSSSASSESFAGNGGAAYSVTTDWQVAGVGDLNGDGLSDIVWRNTAGYVDFWDANAGAGAASFSAQPVVFVSIDWQIQAVGDFNGVGKAGMLWRNANSNDINIWNANAGSGGLYATDLGYLSSDWKFAGVGDFSGDGRQDILWRNSNGEVALWTPTANASSYASVDLGFVSTDWQIQQVGDFNGDGKSDILWRNAASQDVTLWYSKPGAGETFSAVDLGYVSADWRIVAK